MKKEFEALCNFPYPNIEYDEMTEEQALQKLNSQEPVTPKETMDILMSLCNSADKRAGGLQNQIIGSWSYYEGLLNGLLMGVKLITRLDQSSPQVTNNFLKE